MATKYFKKVTFWAREFRLPLFWMIDKRHKILKKDVLVLYKRSVMHCYHLNERREKGAEEGYKFFTNKNNVKRYEKQVEEIRDLLKRISSEYKNIKINKLKDAELKKRFFNTLKLLNLYSDVYTRTEPFFLSKIEADEFKFRSLIKKLGKLRFLLRKEGEPIFYILLGVLLKEIGKRFNLKVADLFFYTYDEIEALFEGKKVRKDIIEKRQKGYTLISLKNKKILLIGEKFKKLFQQIVIRTKKIKKLSGQIAMKGKAKGRVRVILHDKRIIAKEVAKFKKGEILVTEMTRPDTVLACKKAAAIIADEGGITSHAAIISRELKIPCIVGTKIATQVLKDGNLVEVDAEKGVVKIIKRGK